MVYDKNSADVERTIMDRAVNTMLRAFDHVTSTEDIPTGYKEAFSMQLSGNTLVVKLDYRVDDKPVGVWLEYGTRPHRVEPKVLHPRAGVRRGRQTDRAEKSDNPRGTQAPQALSWIQDGRRVFSRGHMVGGISPRFIISRVIQRFKQEMAKEVVHA